MIHAPSVDWIAIAPEVALIVGAFGVLLLATFARAHERGVSVVIGLGTLLVAGAFAVAAWGNAPVLTMANAFRVDDLTELVRITVVIMAALVILLSVGWARFREHGSEFTALLLLVCAGMGIVAGSTSFVTLFVGLELFSLSLYVLCAFDGKSRASLEAGFKYLVLGTIGSIVLVYGAAFLYGATGSFMYGGIADSLAKGGSHSSVVTLGTALQDRCDAVPHVGTRRLRGRAHAGDGLHGWRHQACGVRRPGAHRPRCPAGRTTPVVAGADHRRRRHDHRR